MNGHETFTEDVNGLVHMCRAQLQDSGRAECMVGKKYCGPLATAAYGPAASMTNTIPLNNIRQH